MNYDNLKPFQKIGCDFLADGTSRLLADEMRLGKTMQAICAANKIEADRILVVCPASVKIHWKRSFYHWSSIPLSDQIVYGTKTKIDLNVSIIIINYDLLIYPAIYNQLLKMNFDVGIFDEAHYMKGRKSQRTKVVLLKHGIASRCKYKWFLTGTPILNRPIELYPMVRAAAPDIIKPYLTYTNFARHFCGGYWDGFQFFDKGATNKEELMKRLNTGFMLRRTKKEVFGELDNKTMQLVPIPAEGRVIQEKLTREFNWDKRDVDFQKDLGGGEDIAILRHELGDYKVKHAVSHINYLLTNTNKLVVFAYHKSVIASLKEKLKKYNPVVIDGSTTIKARQRAIDDFQNKEDTRVFIGQYQAAGVGIELSAADTILFVESSWVPGEIDQPADRCFNFADPSPILVQFLVIEGSLDEHMLRTAIEKKINIDQIIKNEEKIQDLFQ